MLSISEMFGSNPKKLVIILLLVVAATGVYQLWRPLPAATAAPQTPAPPKTTAIALPWPAAGQAAVGAAGYGLLAAHNTAAPAPIASLAKIITTLAILQKKPLAGGQGPNITLDSTDANLYSYYYSNDGSAVKVAAGEVITEYQALEGMLIPSGNNLADSMARWAFGSIDNYVTYANQMLKQMDIDNTSVKDASGFTDNTTSTADDLVKLGLKAIANPVIAQIVGQPSASLPVAGQVKNTNWLLGADGVIGLKTGNTEKAGGCYLLAVQHTIQDRKIILVSAVLGAPQLNNAIAGAKALADASDNGFNLVEPIKQGDSLGSYKTAWGASAQTAAAGSLKLLVWQGQDIKIVNDLSTIKAPAKTGTVVGSVSVNSGNQSVKTNAILSRDLSAPSWRWRLIH